MLPSAGACGGRRGGVRLAPHMLPRTGACHPIRRTSHRPWGRVRRSWTDSFNDFKGIALTTLRADLALKVIGSLVKGLIPCLALVAGLRTTFSFRSPGMTNSPV